MALHVGLREREDHGPDRYGEQGAGHPEERGAEQDGDEAEGWVDVDRLGADARLDREVLDLLIEQAVGQHDHAQPRIAAEEPHDHRQDDRDVGADGGHELRDDARPEGQRQPVGQADDGEDDAAEEGVDGREHRSRSDVAPGLVGGDVPDVDEDLLALRRQHARDVLAHSRTVSRQVERDQAEGEEPEDPAQHRDRDAEDALGSLAGNVADGLLIEADLGEELLLGEGCPGDLVEPLQALLREHRQRLDDLDDLVDEELAEGGEEADEEEQHAAHHDQRCESALHVPTQAVDGGRHGEGEEPCHEHGEDDAAAVVDEEAQEEEDEDQGHDDEPGPPDEARAHGPLG